MRCLLHLFFYYGKDRRDSQINAYTRKSGLNSGDHFSNKRFTDNLQIEHQLINQLL